MNGYMRRLALVVMAAFLPGAVKAQGASGTGAQTLGGYIGILTMRCDCTFTLNPESGYRYFSFRSNPVIGEIEDGSPAHGKLRAGDVITHVDGLSILSAHGARRFAGIRPGQDVEITVRRGSDEKKASVTATGLSWRDNRWFDLVAPSPAQAHGGLVHPPGQAVVAPSRVPSTPTGARPGAGAPRVAPSPGTVGGVTTPTPSRPPEPPLAGVGFPGVAPPDWKSPRGWFGFSFRCSSCGWNRSGPGDAMIWEFNDGLPELTLVDQGGPAFRAGFRSGDILTHIDGHSVATVEGGRRLASAEPGQKVRVTVSRNNESMTRDLTLVERPETRAAAAASAPRRPVTSVTPSARRELRYTGKIDNVAIEVWSPAGTSVERTADTIVITVGTTIVRLRADSVVKR